MNEKTRPHRYKLVNETSSLRRYKLVIDEVSANSKEKGKGDGGYCLMDDSENMFVKINIFL